MAVGYDGVAGSAKVAEEWAKRGFGVVKAKIGRRRPSRHAKEPGARREMRRAR